MLLLATLAAQAQNYPARPVKVVVPFSAGSPADNYARLLSDDAHAEMRRDSGFLPF
ncbi:hypothetical protein LBMAG30_03620 [Comamonadaceae bacterium]|nr:hypothetical protein LBMAG30_03620 [Comamonadaceae bacterium]